MKVDRPEHLREIMKLHVQFNMFCNIRYEGVFGKHFFVKTVIVTVNESSFFFFHQTVQPLIRTFISL